MPAVREIVVEVGVDTLSQAAFNPSPAAKLAYYQLEVRVCDLARAIFMPHGLYILLALISCFFL